MTQPQITLLVDLSQEACGFLLYQQPDASNELRPLFNRTFREHTLEDVASATILLCRKFEVSLIILDADPPSQVILSKMLRDFGCNVKVK